MSDIIERAAGVLAVYWEYNHTNEALGRQRMLAQALSQAGLLRDNARTVPTREEIADVVGKQFGQGTNIPQMTDAVLELWEKVLEGSEDLDQPVTIQDINRASGAKFAEPTQDVYEVAAERSSTPSTGSVDAREVLGLPTPEELAQHVADEHGFQAVNEADNDTAFCAKCGKWFDSWDYTKHIADAVLELLAAQPTIAEIKATALEEAADVLDALQTPENDHRSRRDPAAWLVGRADQIREGK